MSDVHPTYPPPELLAGKAHCKDLEHYHQIYQKSIENPEEFWGDLAKQFFWKVKPDSKNILNFNFDPTKGDIFIEWMSGAKTNVCYNVLDRHTEEGNGETIAFLW